METRYRRWATLPDRRATGDRGGDRRRRAEPNAGAGTPGVRPHRMTQNMGRAQCAHTADPCNKAAPSGVRFERQEGCPRRVKGPRPGPILPYPMPTKRAIDATRWQIAVAQDDQRRDLAAKPWKSGEC